MVLLDGTGPRVAISEEVVEIVKGWIVQVFRDHLVASFEDLVRCPNVDTMSMLTAL